MTENIKNSLKIILKGYKESSITEEEVLTLMETIIDTNKGNTITYPISIPTNPWQTTPQPWEIRWQSPYCINSTITSSDSKKE